VRRVSDPAPHGDAGGAPERPVVVIGGEGEFGRFLRLRILPGLGIRDPVSIERSTSATERTAVLSRARHVVLSTPLTGYLQAARSLVRECRANTEPITVWLIPSVQQKVWEAAVNEIMDAANRYLSAVIVHPMYGPLGFAAEEPEARTFQNILTGMHAGEAHPMDEEVLRIQQKFSARLGIETITAFDTREHDRITAASQGLSYCVARAMFEDPALDREVGERLPDLHRSFHADRPLIFEFLRANLYVREIAAAFDDRRRATAGSGLAAALTTFGTLDRELNGDGSLIPTKWYLRLRSSAFAG
jgi:prephenate dehydrogenase